MFTVSERAELRSSLVDRAQSDVAVTAAALVGSSAAGTEDSWSDIDLALRLAPGADALAVASEWTAALYEEHSAVHHLDVWKGPTLYRVFLLANTLQVDVSFWAAEDFRATSPSFRLVFGAAEEPALASPPRVEDLAGHAWLYALHVRSALARNRPWQAVYMLDHLLEQVVALACLRHNVPTHEGRGVDHLPPAVTTALRASRAKDLDLSELRRAFAAATGVLLDELRLADPALTDRISPALMEILAASA